MEKSRLVQITRQSRIAEDDFAAMINQMYEQIWENLYPPQILTDGLPVKVENNIITPKDAPIPDCLDCGACCGSLLCVGVRPVENVLPEDYWDITAQGKSVEIVVNRYLRRNSETFACIALDGEIGVQVGCRIYEDRPKMCHIFEAGSDRCRTIRRAYGIEPFLTVQEMLEAVRKLNAQSEKSESVEIITAVKIEESDGEKLQIKVQLNNKAILEIHEFSPQNETWRQFEFESLTLEQAKDLIASRSQSKASLY